VAALMQLYLSKKKSDEGYYHSPLAQAFDKAKTAAYKRMSNPRIIPLAWFLDEWDAQRELLGVDPWEYGLTPANRRNLETLISYSKAGGLISNLGTVDDFYLDVMLDSRGRGEWDLR
jgi:4,5-dihydroxyphthalate decarboxylase